MYDSMGYDNENIGIHAYKERKVYYGGVSHG